MRINCGGRGGAAAPSGSKNKAGKTVPGEGTKIGRRKQRYPTAEARGDRSGTGPCAPETERNNGVSSLLSIESYHEDSRGIGLKPPLGSFLWLLSKGEVTGSTEASPYFP
ncbi:hypothetical protein NDU88_006507 [Pleurodeles waltl]|uniref:Uncharacterized protein n=1 Tax=Pleurodeles waltl TaxID=8319 RepID=A0AAV7WDU1_PLEWA|nr:hypothetical protein NDU88_006507 [Pleurodeles waltl]